MLCCIGIIAGGALAAATGQMYYLPIAIGMGAVGDFFIFRKFVFRKSQDGRNWFCYGPTGRKKTLTSLSDEFQVNL